MAVGQDQNSVSGGHGKKKADLKETQRVAPIAEWVTGLRGDLCISNHRSCRIKCGCMYFNSRLFLYTAKVVSSPFARSLGCNKTADLHVPFWNTYSNGFKCFTVNKYLSRTWKIWISVSGFLICSMRRLNCKPQRLDLGMILQNPWRLVRGIRLSLVSPQSDLSCQLQ